MSDLFYDDQLLDWLLDPSNPSIRYWTLRDLLGKHERDITVIQTRQDIMSSQPVQAIKEAQINGTYWGNPDDLYDPKYRATTHNLLLLAELGVEPTDYVTKAIEHVFQYQRDSGHFFHTLPKTPRGQASLVTDWCCLDGNILTYLVHFGYLQDRRTQQLLDFLTRHHDTNNGGWPCRIYSRNLKKLLPFNCYMGRMKVLKGLSYIPKSKRSSEIQSIIEIEVEEILRYKIIQYLKHSDGSPKDKAGWKKFGFPLFYTTDLLEILDVLVRLGMKDNRMKYAIDLVESQQQPDGTWILRNSFNGKMDCLIEEKHKSSKWITLRALRILSNCN